MVSIRKRPVDAIYIGFFLLHLIASLLVDGQAFYPPTLVPSALKQILADYIKDTNDPLISNVGTPRFAWFTMMVALEMLIQVPAFFVGITGLWKGAEAATHLDDCMQSDPTSRHRRQAGLPCSDRLRLAGRLLCADLHRTAGAWRREALTDESSLPADQLRAVHRAPAADAGGLYVTDDPAHPACSPKQDESAMKYYCPRY